ncbi:dihydropteroate synthase [Arcanobacterium hippocoleae]|uniref:dihydropteroate synthase n=2 Tax=Arcanobacterium hippocoleae TaxID=149017 RepID=A0ABU1T3C9_9ACTO|nr:dihydropteroate synthase [Arcanobacterium hippocoleae]MDR6939869.1 dihydropteroate synthase [Arcanobacterium hippocoleae]
MGILNVTPDSFSDGGKWADAQCAIDHGQELLAQGAQIIDIGGESTRPGAQALSADEEWERIAPVVRALAPLCEVSVDTYHAYTAQKAVEAGAAIVNDVSGGQIDAQMFATVANLDCKYILQHSRGSFAQMNSFAEYHGEINDVVISELLARRDLAVAAGISPERIVLDPGLGFAKLGMQDWQILRATERYLDLGHKILIGHSRKRFLASLAGADLPAAARDFATGTVSGVLSQIRGAISGAGVWAVRVHNVEATRQAINAIKMMDLQTVLPSDLG